MTVAPFVAAGWAGQSQDSVPWQATSGIRPVAGVAVDLFMRLIRLETGVSLRTGDVGFTVDINRDWWGVL
jgi:hypothetical protein